MMVKQGDIVTSLSQVFTEPLSIFLSKSIFTKYGRVILLSMWCWCLHLHYMDIVVKVLSSPELQAAYRMARLCHSSFFILLLFSVGAPVAQWVKRWATDQVDLGFEPA